MHVRTRTWFGFVVATSIVFLVVSLLGIFDPLESAVQSVASPVESTLRGATRPVADVVNNLTDINRLSDENRGLQEQNERLTEEVARLREVETELTQLRQLADVRKANPDESFVGATVFAEEPSNQQDLVAIDVGREDGIREGMSVFTRQGSLVGTVTRVLERSSWVTLITDSTSAVSTLLQASRVQGVVVGSGDGTLTMEFVEETADVNEGDVVLTSGLGGRFPAGELIGQVVQVDRGAQELFQAVRVEPLADLSRLEDVLVLVTFLPLEAGEP